MIKRALSLSGLLVIIYSGGVHSQSAWPSTSASPDFSTPGAPTEDDAWADARLLILGSDSNFFKARRTATKISRATKMPFSDQGQIYDRSRGLIFPDTFPDEVWAGGYAARRYNETQDTLFITIERSEAYEGLRPGLYIIVGRIFTADEPIEPRLTWARRFVRDAYVKKTRIWFGCMH